MFLFRLVNLSFILNCKEIIFCLKLHIKIYWDGIKFYFNLVHFWKGVSNWIRDKILFNWKIANQNLLDYSKPTLDVALYYRKYNIKDIGSWMIFLVIAFIIWQTGFISIFFINFYYYFSQSNHLLLSFLRFDIFLYPLFFYDFVIAFIVNKSYFIMNYFFVLLI